jgi:hypothetical protein
MRILATFTAAFLFMLAGLSVPAFSQDRDESKPQAQEEKNKDKDKDRDARREGRPEARPEGRSQQEQPAARPEERREPQAQPGHEQREQRPEQRQMEQRDNQQHPMNAHQGKKIPDEKFRASFGHEHRFKARQVITTRTIVPNQTQFVFSGYTFVFAEPWPAEWAFDDDVYVDYIDGEYFLIDPFHPGIRVVVFIAGY